MFEKIYPVPALPLSDKVTCAITIVQRLVDNGYIALFAGGFVRDLFISSNSESDIDIATNAYPKDIQRLFSHVVGVGEQFGVMLVIESGFSYEIATFRSDSAQGDGRRPDSVSFTSAQKDALRRDFTINGLFLDPINGKIIDYVNGYEDITKRIIRTIGNPRCRFTEDFLRLIRAIRFSARFSFTIETETWEAICSMANSIENVSKERIFQELTKMITGPNPDQALLLLDSTGLLETILPEVSLLKGVEQPIKFHPEGDVFTHTVDVLSYIDNRSAIASWSALLHDVGKPQTRVDADRIRFNNHHVVGSSIAKKILLRLKCSRHLVEAVTNCVENHMNFMNVQNMRLFTLKQFLARPTIEYELSLHKADCLASHGNLDNYNFLLEKKKELALTQIKPKPLVTGKDLLSIGFSQGPLLGSALKTIYELQLDEQIQSKEEAIKWLLQNKNLFFPKNLI